MVENQHKKIEGYRDLQQDEIDLMNDIKEAEIQVAEVWKHVIRQGEDSEVAATLDLRWANIAKTHFQEGFSALVRAVAKPRDPFRMGEEATTQAPSNEDVAALNELSK